MNVTLPNVRDSGDMVQNLYDAYYKLRKELSFLLQNLDEENVLKAKSVVADWVYAGQVTTDQLIAGTAKIGTALIEDLIVGGNVVMGPNATISWGQVTNQPHIPVLPGYIQATYIDHANVVSPNIMGGTITGGRIISDSEIEVITNARIGDNLYLGNQFGFDYKAIFFNQVARLETYQDIVGFGLSLNCSALKTSGALEGTWSCANASFTNLKNGSDYYATESWSDTRYYTKSQVDSLVGGVINLLQGQINSLDARVTALENA